MFKQNHYVPVLKWKRGERNALENLDSSLKEFMTPLIEIQPITFDFEKEEFKKTLDEHLSSLGNEIKKSWGVNAPIFIDLDTLYLNESFTDEFVEGGEHAVDFAVNVIENEDIAVIPVTGIRRSEEFQNAVNRMSGVYNRGVCIRLEESDLSDLDTLAEQLYDLIHSLELRPENIDIILDYKQILSQKKEEHIKELIITIARFPELQNWRTFTLLSTAYPKTLKEIPTNSEGTLPRTEWSVYKELRNLELARTPSFGDYNITSPYFVNVDPRVLTLAAGVRYTAEDNFLIFRGVVIKKNGFTQMIQIAKNILSNSSFYGPDFSSGDSYIYKCANQIVGTGNAETWVTVGINHHLTVVAYDFSNQFAASMSH